MTDTYLVVSLLLLLLAMDSSIVHFQIFCELMCLSVLFRGQCVFRKQF